MKEEKYYKEITKLIEEKEINKRVRELKDNSETILAYWNIGKLIVEAQGGVERAKYGDNLIKKWGDKLASDYGKNYGRSNLFYMRQFYIVFPIVHSLSGQLTWTHFRNVLPLKNENERNYYINLAILNNLSVRELRKEIKNKSYDRLSYADKENIKLITDIDNYNLTIKDMIKDPLLIKPSKNIDKLTESSLHKYIIEMLKDKFLELGTGFALLGHEYKFKVDNKTFKIDLLFFNIETNSFVVVEVKLKELQPKDIGQLEFYVNYVDKNLKKSIHNKTIGVIIVKKKNKYVIEYITNKNLYITTFKITD